VHEYGVRLTPWIELPKADAIVAAVAHREFASLTVAELGEKLVDGAAFIDVKASFEESALNSAGYSVWRL
jgi:UDP-N-acetyl-D-glucosamine/UDP-N-acetyl-D-galactosamine dehydrogenase